MAITARGTKYGNGLFNECQVTLTNLTKDTQDYILTQTSPYNLNHAPKVITIDAGRQSYGTTRIFTGTVFTAKPTQPPDISVILRCLENGFNGGNIINQNQGTTQLSTISKQAADANGLTLIFEATDGPVSNFSYTGAANGLINALSEQGPSIGAGIDVFQDGTRLIVKNKNVPLTGPTRIINKGNGMIGIPEFVEYGIRVKYLLDNITSMGRAITVESEIYPAVNGTYIIYKLDFDIATRENPFYYIAEASRLP